MSWVTRNSFVCSTVCISCVDLTFDIFGDVLRIVYDLLIFSRCGTLAGKQWDNCLTFPLSATTITIIVVSWMSVVCGELNTTIIRRVVVVMPTNKLCLTTPGTNNICLLPCVVLCNIPLWSFRNGSITTITWQTPPTRRETISNTCILSRSSVSHCIAASHCVCQRTSAVSSTPSGWYTRYRGTTTRQKEWHRSSSRYSLTIAIHCLHWMKSLFI